MKQIPIKFEEIPIKIIVNIKEVEYKFTFQYSDRFDFFTILVEWETNKYSTKIIYAENLVPSYLPFILVAVTKDDFIKSDWANAPVNKETFGITVNLYYEDEF